MTVEAEHEVLKEQKYQALTAPVFSCILSSALSTPSEAELLSAHAGIAMETVAITIDATITNIINAFFVWKVQLIHLKTDCQL